MNIRSVIEKNLIKLNNKEYFFEKENDKYVGITYNEYIKKVKTFASYLCNNDLKNKRILLIGKNSINFLIADLAITVYSSICVNVNRDTKEEDIKGLIKELNIKAIVYTDDEKEKIDNIKTNILKINIDEFKFNNEIDESIFKKYNPNSCTKIFFSSGTTSKPKAAKLTLKNIFAGYKPLQARTKFTKDDVIYLFLPLHHTYGSVYNFYYSLIYGGSMYLSSGVNNIFSELREVNPTLFCAVPLIYERAMQAAGENLKYAFGSRIKYLYIGGAPVDVQMRETYKNAGLTLLNAYALTETGSSFSIDYPNDIDYESVGTIFENLDVKIINEVDGIGEIVVKGPAVFQGYTNRKINPFTEDGYFKTGDLGYIKGNKLYLKGRKKKILIGSNGENISIAEIEEGLKALDSNINQVLISLNKNDIVATFFLEDKSLSNIEEVVKKYNETAVQKNKVKKYSISNKKRNEKLL